MVPPPDSAACLCLIDRTVAEIQGVWWRLLLAGCFQGLKGCAAVSHCCLVCLLWSTMRCLYCVAGVLRAGAQSSAWLLRCVLAQGYRAQGAWRSVAAVKVLPHATGGERCDYSLKQGCLIVYAGRKRSFPSHVLLLFEIICFSWRCFQFFSP